MSNKTRNAQKAKTESGRNRLAIAVLAAIFFIVVFIVLSVRTVSEKSESDCGYTETKKLSCLLKLEYATTGQQWERGLSGRDNMPDDVGMLFVFDKPSEQCMWMKDMRFSLDMIWLNENKRIEKIEKNVSPDTYPGSFCAQNSKYVLELKPDTVDRLGFNVGDSIQL